jgi:hypothetical protein
VSAAVAGVGRRPATVMATSGEEEMTDKTIVFEFMLDFVGNDVSCVQKGVATFFDTPGGGRDTEVIYM